MTNTKKCTVKDFCKKYNDAKSEQTKETLIHSVMDPHYVPYEMKITICEKIVEASYYTTTDKNGVNVKKLHVNSPAQYMLYCMNLVKEYTNIEVDFKDVLKEFNLLNKSDLVDIIHNNIPEKELREFQIILDMVRNDVMQNEYETHAFISNQVERFGELFGRVVSPALEKLSDTIANMDEKEIDKMINRLTGSNGLSGLKGKFNIVK